MKQCQVHLCSCSMLIYSLIKVLPDKTVKESQEDEEEVENSSPILYDSDFYFNELRDAIFTEILHTESDSESITPSSIVR